MKYRTEEGFHKETYEVLKGIGSEPHEGYMPLVYICSPFAEIGRASCRERV